MTGRFRFNGERQLASPYSGQEFLAGLNGAFRPAMLLGLETVHVHRQFRRRHDVCEENKFPASELSAVAKIEILAKRIMLPPAAFLDARTAPEPGRAVEVKEPPAAAARRLFKEKMAIEEHGLHASE